MSATLERDDEPRVVAPRRLRPGWGYAADLTPPERVVAYRLRRLRERILLAVCLVVLLSAAGFAYGFWALRQADLSLHDARGQGQALQQQAGQYGHVIEIQAGAARVRTELGTLLAGDVDVATLLDKIIAAAPPGVHVDTLTVTVADDASGAASGAPAPVASAAPTAASSAAPTSGRSLGTVELNASGRTIDDAPAYADALARIPGLADVLPTSNTAQGEGTTFSLTVELTDALLTHRFAPTTPAGTK